MRLSDRSVACTMRMGHPRSSSSWLGVVARKRGGDLYTIRGRGGVNLLDYTTMILFGCNMVVIIENGKPWWDSQ